MRLNFLYGAILSLLLLASCGQLEKPVLNYIDQVKIRKPGLEKSLVTFNVQCFNPNATRARLRSAQGEAWLDSNYIGHFVVDTSVMIPARANFTIPVKLEVDMKKMLVYSLNGFKNENVYVKVIGKARVSKSLFSKNISIDYAGNQNLQGLVR